MSFIFLITGASSGFGAAIAIHALKAGHNVIATARSVDQAKKAYPMIEELGGIWLTLNVTSLNTETIVSDAVKQYKVNVLINNAGYALRGVLEDLSMQQFRDQMETNLFGALACTKGVLPHFRERKEGTIVNISSTSGISGNAGYTAYAASKFAMEGWSESLAAEMACFGVRVVIVEPGGFRTNFQAAVTASEGSGDGEFVSEPYRGTPADQAAKRISGGHGKQPGDPEKAASAIVEVVTGIGRGQDVKQCLRLPLGKDAVLRAEAKIKTFQENVEKTKHIAEGAVFDA